MPPIDETLAVGDPGHVSHHQQLAQALNLLPTTVLETLSDVVENSDSLNAAITAAIAARVAGEGFAPEVHSHLTPMPSVEGVLGLVEALAAKLDADDASGTYVASDGEGGYTVAGVPVTLGGGGSGLLYVGTIAAPVTNAATVRPVSDGPVYWLCGPGVTPTNALDGDLIVNKSA